MILPIAARTTVTNEIPDIMFKIAVGLVILPYLSLSFRKPTPNKILDIPLIISIIILKTNLGYCISLNISSRKKISITDEINKKLLIFLIMSYHYFQQLF